MKNVAIIITKLNGGGAERCASNLSIELSKKYNVTLIAFDASNPTYPHGGELIDLKTGSSTGFFRKVLNVIKRVRKIKSIKKLRKIDCAISLLDGPNLVNILSSRGEKTVVSIRNMLSHEPMGKLRKKIIKYTSNRADLTVALSEMVKSDLVNYFSIPESKITTIYNHCDATLLKNLTLDTPPFEIDQEKFNYITMGRLNSQKGQWHLIRAFKKVVATVPHAHLYIVGEGELRDRLLDLITALNLENSITLTGYIPNPHSVYRFCDVFVFSSLFEGLGNVLLEALAFDMPIISCDCLAGPREILAPNTDIHAQASDIEFEKYGVLVPVCDGNHFNASDALSYQEECLANAMIHLYTNETLRNNYRTNAKIRIRDFDRECIMQHWSSIIEET